MQNDYQKGKSLKEQNENLISDDQNCIDGRIREIRFKSNGIERYKTGISGMQTIRVTTRAGSPPGRTRKTDI